MKRTTWNCFWAFIPLSYRISMFVMAGLMLLGGFVLYHYMEFVAIMVAAPIIIVAIGFIDYQAFSGINSVKNKTMEFIRTSNYGPRLLRNAFLIDIISKNIIFLLGFGGMITFGLIEQINIVAVLDIMLITAFLTNLMLITTRRMENSIMTHLLILYAFVIVAFILIFFYSVLISGIKDTAVRRLGDIIVTGVSAMLTVLTEWLLFRDCNKCFARGYSDNQEGRKDKT